MTPYPGFGAQPRTGSIAALAVVTAVLYLARDVLIPLALAILLSFLLAPAVRRLERLRLGRIASTAVVVILGFSLIGSIGWVAASQAISLTAKLPEYRDNITQKLVVNACLAEPWLYGRSAGLSAIAIIAAALFWTWLWGPVGLLLATPLTAAACEARLIPFPILGGEIADAIAAHSCKIVCISAVPPEAATQAGYLCKRLRARFPESKIVVGLWSNVDNIDKTRQRLAGAGADVVVTSLAETIEALRLRS